MFLTDAASGRTRVWRAPARRAVLSSQAAARLARRLPLQWRSDVDDVPLRQVTEPRPVFADGRLYYLVSVVPTRYSDAYLGPVDYTVLADAAERVVVETFDHAYPRADHRLRAFFRRTADRGVSF